MKRKIDPTNEIIILSGSGKVKHMDEEKLRKKLKNRKILPYSVALFPIRNYGIRGHIPYVIGDDEFILENFDHFEVEYQIAIRYVEYDTNFGEIYRLPVIEKEYHTLIDLFNVIHSIELIGYFDELNSESNAEVLMKARSYIDIKLFNLTIYDEDGSIIYNLNHKVKLKDMKNEPDYLYCYPHIYELLEGFYDSLTMFDPWSDWESKLIAVDLQDSKWTKLDDSIEDYILSEKAEHYLVGIYSEYSNTFYFIESEAYRRFKMFQYIDVTYIRHYQHSSKFIKNDGDPYELHHIGTQESISIILNDLSGQVDFLNTSKYIAMMMRLQMKYDPFFVHHEGAENAIPILIIYISLEGEEGNLVTLNYMNDQVPTLKHVLMNAKAAMVADTVITEARFKGFRGFKKGDDLE